MPRRSLPATRRALLHKSACAHSRACADLACRCKHAFAFSRPSDRRLRYIQNHSSAPISCNPISSASVVVRLPGQRCVEVIVPRIQLRQISDRVPC